MNLSARASEPRGASSAVARRLQMLLLQEEARMDEPTLDGITTTLGDLVAAVYEASESEEEALVVLARLLARATSPLGRLAA